MSDFAGRFFDPLPVRPSCTPVMPTELVELIDVRGGRISSHIEFFVPI